MADDGMTMGYLMGQSENGGNGGFGGMFGEGLWAIIILAMLGFGRGGFGFGGGGYDGGCATQADVRAAVDQQTLISKLDQQTYGLADSTYALNNTITNGFHGVDNALCTLGHQMSDCCCQTQRAIDGVNYNMAKGFCDLGNVINMQTRDIIDNQNANYRGLMDFLVQEKLSSKDAQIAQLQNQVSQANQTAAFRAAIDASTAEIIRRTGHECPTPAYWVTPPTPVQAPNNGCSCCY